MAEYRSKYYTLKTSIKKHIITIEVALKIRMLNNLDSSFKSNYTLVNDQIWRDKNLKENNILFKAIEEK